MEETSCDNAYCQSQYIPRGHGGDSAHKFIGFTYRFNSKSKNPILSANSAVPYIDNINFICQTNLTGSSDIVHQDNEGINMSKRMCTTRPLQVKIGAVYPGFHTFYALGGWPGDPGWTIPVEVATLQQTLDLAIAVELDAIQICTWNDWGEGTIVEPSREFGNSFLNMLQDKFGAKYGNKELNIVRDVFLK